ncbi:MAG: PSD1 domain-containing protein [Planctomycetes bacterium]|nr:PSD1 domain-containing protein [Planctomycetota bacterium]
MHVFRRWCLLLFVLAGFSSEVAAEPEWSREQVDFFEKQIRPVLAAQCWNCHGEKKAESGLRLDSREAVLKGGDRGEIVAPREVTVGLLMHALRRDGELQMPPNGRLTSGQVSAFAKWIEQGLPWPRDAAGSAMSQAWLSHWAFQPVRKPVVPGMAADIWSLSPIDRFILEQEPNAVRHQARKSTLIRRLSFDLTGLPPTPDEVAEFEADAAPDAYERLVDRLLASPRHGERWGRYWLDVARYADTKGYVFFEEKSYPWAYTYRDYVIQSLNEDKPYYRFLLEQIAADQLENHTDASLAGLGFLTVGGHFMGNVHDIVDDRIDVVTRGVMGLTVTCARCHDHKYDPIPTADYYSLYGVFRSSTEPLVLPLFSTPQDTPAYRRFTAELSVRQQNLDDFVAQKHAALVEGARTRAGEYLLAAKLAGEKPATDDFMLIADPGDLNPAMIVRWQSYLEKIEGQGTAGSDHGFKHPVWGVWFQLASIPADRFPMEAARLCAELASPAKSHGTNPLVVKAVCGDVPPSTLAEAANRYGLLLKSIHADWQTRLRDAVILKRPTPTALENADEEQLRLELYGETAPANVPLVFGWGFLSLLPDRASQGEYQKVLKEVEQWLINGPAAPPRAMVLLDGPTYDPRVFIRGNPNRPGDAVSRHFLSALSADPQRFTRGSGRLELAQAIVDPGNPLTSRVAVNRLWQNHFGTGLVRTPGDFGLRSDPPTHPELLDWLAKELIGADRPSDRWSIKRLHRQIVTSATYQQSSQDLSATDPENRRLSRANRVRLDFEATRDALLAVTGQLDDRIGGPSRSMLDGGFHPRRTLYAYLDRQDPPGLLSVFDVPSSAATSTVRDTTTVSPQALYMMNGPFVATCADLILRRPDVAGIPAADARVQRIYRILFARDPQAAELRLALDFLGEQPSAAVWQEFFQALLLTNEFVFVD